MPRYKKAPDVVDAMQWKGDNDAEIGNFLHDGTSWAHMPGAEHLYVEGDDWSIDVVPSDWIVRDARGRYTAWANDNFQLNFELIPQLQSVELVDEPDAQGINT